MGANNVAVADAGPILHLYEIDLIELFDIWNQVLIPQAVWDETVAMQRVPENRLTEMSVFSLRYVPTDALRQFVREFQFEKLHAGEQECLFVCREEGVPFLLTDDLAVRRAAKRLGVRPVGSLGVIVRGYRLGRFSLREAKMHLRALQNVSSLFVTPEIVELAIRQLE